MMKSRPLAKWSIFSIVAVALCGAPWFLQPDSNRGNSVSAALAEQELDRPSRAAFNRNGELVRPAGYRKWIYVGTPLTPHDMNDGHAAFPEFHSVYIDPEAFRHYEETGTFPDGTVLVKELVSVGSKKATSGNGYFMGDFTGLEVLIKDEQRFADQPGHWGFFSFGHEYPLKETARLQPTANCNTCHGAAADEDFVFTQYYPVLRSAKPAAK